MRERAQLPFAYYYCLLPSDYQKSTVALNLTNLGRSTVVGLGQLVAYAWLYVRPGLALNRL